MTKEEAEMAGGKNSLLENSRNLCAAPSKATVEMTAQSGRTYSSKPALKVKCGKKSAGKKKKRGAK